MFDGNSPFTEYSPSFTRATGGFFTYANGTTYFNRADNLGTPRLSTDYTGAVQRTESVLMGPFGDDFTETLSTLDFTGFAGGFWDSENNGDHFGAREYQKTHGSWLSPDPAGMAAVNPWNPQTWNRYAYVLNNPVSLKDPSGLVDPDGGVCSVDDYSCVAGGAAGLSDETLQEIYNSGDNPFSVVGPDGTGPTFYSQASAAMPGDDGDSQDGDPDSSGGGITPSYSVSVYAPLGYGVGGYTYTSTHLASKGQPTYNCSSHSGTISTPAAKAVVSGGPLTLFGQSTTSAMGVISSWGWNFSLQAFPWLGYQVNINSSGVVGGFTFGVPGASASYGWGSCKKGG